MSDWQGRKWKGPLAQLLEDCRQLPDEWQLSLVFDADGCVDVIVEDDRGQAKSFGEYGQPIGDAVERALMFCRGSMPSDGQNDE